MAESINSFREFISFFPDNHRYRTFEFLFLNSKKVKNLNEYYLSKYEKIDFEIKNKLISKISDETYPIGRLSKKSFFYNGEILVQEGVFVPRPETECLVEITCNWIKKLNLSNFYYLDLCTGSGNVLHSILSEFPTKITKYGAVDVSLLSCINTLVNFKKKTLNLNGSIYCSNWTTFLNKKSVWEVITINPPYIGLEDFPKFNSKILYKYDPKWALQSGSNGWSHYEKLIEFALTNMNWKLICLECNEFHESLWDNLELIHKNIQINKYIDYLGKFRVVVLNRI